MTSKTQNRIKMLLYGVVLLLALLMDSAAFGALHPRYTPCVIPIAVACIGLWEGTERGIIFGLIGGCLVAWSGSLSMYGAWQILVLTLVGLVAGILSEQYLLQSLKTILSVSAGALFFSEGLYTIFLSVSGSLPAGAFFNYFLPCGLLSLIFVALFYPVTAYISRIGGFHG